MEFVTKFLVAVIIVFTISMISCIIIDNAQNTACEEIGYTKFKQTENFAFCVDKHDNLHYINWNFCGFFKVCIKEISVGDVRVKPI